MSVTRGSRQYVGRKKQMHVFDFKRQGRNEKKIITLKKREKKKPKTRRTVREF